MKGTDIITKAIRSQDIQTGLQSYEISQFEKLILGGMASRLALHLRGRGPVAYENLKEIAFILFGVPKLSFDSVMNLLQEVKFVRVIGKKEQVIPDIPYFDDMYSYVGEYIVQEGLNQFEEHSIELLNIASSGPISREFLLKELDVKQTQLDKLVNAGEHGTYIQSFETEESGQLYISPLYFSENPTELAKLVGKNGTDTARRVIELLRENPGWPLSLAQKNMRINTSIINDEELQFLESLILKKVIQPPSIETAHSKEIFLFTPNIGNERIPIIEKDIYERAMAIISSIRHGQYFARYNIKYPRAIINALKRDGWLRATTSAKDQYRALAVMKVCKLVNTNGNYHEVHLIKSPENYKAIDLALEIIDRQGNEPLQDRGINHVANAVLSGDMQYSEFIRAYSKVQLKNQISELKKSAKEIDLLLEDIMKG